jgi:hypothetical protein
MNRYEKENTAEAIGGYFIKRPEELNDIPAFLRAKAELSYNIMHKLELINEMSVKQFLAQTKR